MNEHDKFNLEFLMSLQTTDDWTNWANSCTEDDLRYAMDLIKTAQAECTVREMGLDEDEQDEEGLDCSDAMCIINQIKQSIKNGN